ncbi:hypothetical protein QBC45DRAFT_390941 [Copromyces sp. CBS 386.78]|nr:hypothetical protein QBC45DRAFT_390941 [Copromyces sp. CBS 386.78]
MYSHWSGRRDKRGLPICILDIASLDTATTKSYGRDHLVDIVSFSFKQAWKRASVRIGYQQAVGDLLSRPEVVARVYRPLNIENMLAQYGGRLNIKLVDFATQLCPGMEGTLGEIPAGPIKFVVDEQGGRNHNRWKDQEGTGGPASMSNLHDMGR